MSRQGLTRLRQVVRGLDSVLVAFSGGVDSALVAAVCHEQLGSGALALTAHSESFPVEEAQVAAEVSAAVGLAHLVLPSSELDHPGYRANAGERCFFCKDTLFALAHRVARERGLAWVADGTLAEDLVGHRPGLRAARDHSVRHPLVEAGMSKAEVREAARSLGLKVWDKPSFACLGSRFAPGTPIDESKLTRVATIESALRRLGVRQLRVRWHELGDDVLVRIEVRPSDLGLLTERRQVLIDVCEQVGVAHVTVDLRGYPEARDV